MDTEVTPSASIISAANATIELTDLRGRKLTVKKLSVLDQVRLMRAMGDHSGNQIYAFSVQCAASVVKIDGRPVPFPTNERQIDSAIERLGDDGFGAVQLHLMNEMKRSRAEIERAAADAETTDDASESAS